MTSSENSIACIGCGALVPDSNGPTHKYLDASPGCFALFSEVLANEYSDFRYARVHHLTTDTYPLQHPGTPSPQTIQSAAVHLISLYLTLERDFDPMQAAQVKQKASQHKQHFAWLDPPATFGEITIVDVHAAPDANAHIEIVSQWAKAVWTAWHAYHEMIHDWARRFGFA